MTAQTRLLRQLADGGFHSGQLLARELGISRTAVWKRLKGLERELGLQLQAVRGRGYRLAAPLELLQAERIEASLEGPSRQLLGGLHIHPSIDSTNSWLMRQAGLGAASGTVCLAESQTAGKGRHGRRWVSPFGKNIYLSLLWRFDLAPAEAAGMSLVAALAVLRGLQQIGCHEAGLKWPNDILWRERKLAGLLLEVAGDLAGPSRVVIGVGLNIQLDPGLETIDQPWTDLASIPGLESPGRNRLAAHLIGNLLEACEAYPQSGLEGCIAEWRRHDLLRGRELVLRSANQSYRGSYLGIDKQGALRLLVDGEPRRFLAGEVSLRSE